jgi:hypothetical protein
MRLPTYVQSQIEAQRKGPNRREELYHSHAHGTLGIERHLLRVPLLYSIRTETGTKVFIRHATPFTVRVWVVDVSKSQAKDQRSKTKEVRNANAMYPKFPPIDAVP